MREADRFRPAAPLQAATGTGRTDDVSGKAGFRSETPEMNTRALLLRP